MMVAFWLIFVGCISLTKAQSPGWQLAATDRCVSAVSFANGYSFNPPFGGEITGIKLVHKSGGVNCDYRIGPDSNWGCAYYTKFMAVLIKEDSLAGNTLYYPTSSTEGVTSVSPWGCGNGCTVQFWTSSASTLNDAEIVLMDPSTPYTVSVDDTFSVQNSEGCCVSSTGDNRGTECSDVYFYYSSILPETCYDVWDDLLSTTPLNEILDMQSEIYTLSGGQSVRCSFVDLGDSTILVSTLFETASFANAKRGQPLQRCALNTDCAYNEEDVGAGESQSLYRWSKASITDYRTQSMPNSIDGTVYLFLTCNQNLAMDVDFMLLPFNADFLTSNLGGACYEITAANIRGYECADDVGTFWEHDDAYHFHLDSNNCGCGGCCAWNEGSIHGEDSFGDYDYYNPAFSCAATNASTTDYWMGVAVEKPVTPAPTPAPTAEPTAAPTNVCAESEIATFDWGTLTKSGEAKPEISSFDMSIDKTDLSLHIALSLTLEGRSSADYKGAVFGTTYVLDFEDFDANAHSIAAPGTCQNRVADDFGGAFDSFWEYPLNPSSGLGTAPYLAYPPPGDLWSVTVDQADECGVVVYSGRFTWNDLVACQDSALSTHYVTPTDDADSDGKLKLQGTFYVNVVSPYAATGDTGYYRVYQLLSQPFVISVNKNLQVLGAAGINLFTISVIAVYKQADAALFKLIVLTESAEYLQLSRSGVAAGLAAFVSSSAENSAPEMTAFSVADTAETGDECLHNKAYICSQLWQIESAGDCSHAQSQFIDFSGDYTLQFTPVCRSAEEVGSAQLQQHCDDWLFAHPDEAAGVGLTATLQWRDEECDPLLFEVQFQAEMLFYTDAEFTLPAENATLYQVGEDRIYAQVKTTFPDAAYDVFDTQLLNVWICTFDPLHGPQLPIEAGELSGGCFSDGIDGHVDGGEFGADNLYAYHIYDSQSTVSVPDVIEFVAVGHPSDADSNLVRFSFVVPPQIARDTLYVHAQIEVSLSGAPRRRRQLLAAMAGANQMEHFLGNVGVSPHAQPRPVIRQPARHDQIPSVDNNSYLLSLQSPWLMAILGGLAVVLTLNIAFMCYMRCCGGPGAARVSFGGRYKAVKVNDSEVDDSEAHAMNVASE